MQNMQEETEAPEVSIELKAPTAMDRKEVRSMFFRMFEEEVYTASTGTEAYRKNIEDFYYDTQEKFGYNGQMLAWTEGRIAGFIWILRIKHFVTGQDMGMVGSLYVHPHFRGKGVAKKLMEWAEEYSRRNGYSGMTLNVFSENAAAKKLYKKMGYVEISSTMEKSLEI